MAMKKKNSAGSQPSAAETSDGGNRERYDAGEQREVGELVAHVLEALNEKLAGSSRPVLDGSLRIEIETKSSTRRTRIRLKSFRVLEHDDDLKQGERVPDKAEKSAVGAVTSKIVRDSQEFKALIENQNGDIVFKDEEGTGADRMMTSKLEEKLATLAKKVKTEWSGVKLRVTEAWDENDEHGTNSIHYEARAADLTTWPVDGAKLGRLARLAVESGLEWVFYENALHVHVSMSK